MKEKLVEIIKEIIVISEKCDEPYKVECFKLLLKHELEKSVNNTPQVLNSAIQDTEVAIEKKQREINDSDLHIKFKNFMKKYNVSIDKINQLFYFENETFLGMYDDLKTTKASEVQIRIALLQAMICAMNNGEFEFDGEAVRAECQKRKAYDLPNFTANFKYKAGFFDKFETYKKGNLIKLSEVGKEELSKIIEEISQ